jgi:hypothetical protein
MTPQIGQRWKHTHFASGRVFIAEVSNIYTNGYYAIHILQNILGKTNDYSSLLQNEFGWTWEYLPGQDK